MKKEPERACIAIDLKSFYASVECLAREMDPLRICLVVADESRTEKTICLAVSPALKTFGVPGRPRLFEVLERVREVNAERLKNAPGHCFTGESSDIEELSRDPSLKLSFHVALPRMAEYMKISNRIYEVYLRYIAPEDIHIYSIDEVFMEVESYLNTYQLTPRALAGKMIHEVMDETGITATAGVGTNLYLAKVAMDIVAKHMPPDENGVRIAELTEASYRRMLWSHRPLTDFWRVGHGISEKLEKAGLFTMGDIARCSLGSRNDFYNEDLLYKLFGVNAELLIDHAWGYEPCRIRDIHSYTPENSSTGSGQVLHEPYTNEKAKVIVTEMADSLSLGLFEQGLVADRIVLTINYDRTSSLDGYKGEVKKDRYGRNVPKPAQGTKDLGKFTSSTRAIVNGALELFSRITDPTLLIRAVYITALNTRSEKDPLPEKYEQFDLFTDPEALAAQKAEEDAADDRERRLQQAQLEIRRKFGSNAILRGTSLREGATGIERNGQIGGHRE